MGLAIPIVVITAGVLYGLYRLSKYVYRRTGKRYYAFGCFAAGFLVLFGDQLLASGYMKWFCHDPTPLKFPDNGQRIRHLDLNWNQRSRGPQGCGNQCVSALIQYKFDSVEADVKRPNPANLVTTPGSYRFYLADGSDPKCVAFWARVGESGSGIGPMFNGFRVPDGRCIASEKIDERTVKFVGSGGSIIKNNMILDIFQYNPSIYKTIDSNTKNIVAAVEEYHLDDGWYFNKFRHGPTYSSCISRRFIRWPKLAQLSDL